jgi:chitin disaccharide deacetylase
MRKVFSRKHRLLDWRVRRLIINADDFGLTSGVNRGIVEASTRGIVSSATLMASGDAFNDATASAKSLTRFSLGCHIVLVDGRPVLDGRYLPGLTATHDNQFDPSLTSFAVRVLSGRLENEIEAEAVAQIRKVESAGVTVSHLDSHKHTHILPGVLRPLVRAARACGVRAIRNPFGPVRFSVLLEYPRLWRQYSKVKVLHALAGKFRQTVTEAGLLTTDGTVGVVATGSLNTRLFQHILDTLPEGTWELVCHPGYNDADLDRIHTRLRESRVTELQLLTSANAREMLARAGIELISYRDLS